MNWITPHSLFSLNWDEWASIIAILGAVVVLLRSLINTAERKLFEPTNQRLDKFNDSVDFLIRWQQKADDRLGRGDRKFIKHDEELKDHEHRITKLEEERISNGKNN